MILPWKRHSFFSVCDTSIKHRFVGLGGSTRLQSPVAQLPSCQVQFPFSIKLPMNINICHIDMYPYIFIRQYNAQYNSYYIIYLTWVALKWKKPTTSPRPCSISWWCPAESSNVQRSGADFWSETSTVLAQPTVINGMVQQLLAVRL